MPDPIVTYSNEKSGKSNVVTFNISNTFNRICYVNLRSKLPPVGFIRLSFMDRWFHIRSHFHCVVYEGFFFPVSHSITLGAPPAFSMAPHSSFYMRILDTKRLNLQRFLGQKSQKHHPMEIWPFAYQENVIVSHFPETLEFSWWLQMLVLAITEKFCLQKYIFNIIKTQFKRLPYLLRFRIFFTPLHNCWHSTKFG